MPLIENRSKVYFVYYGTFCKAEVKINNEGDLQTSSFTFTVFIFFGSADWYGETGNLYWQDYLTIIYTVLCNALSSRVSESRSSTL